MEEKMVQPTEAELKALEAVPGALDLLDFERVISGIREVNDAMETVAREVPKVKLPMEMFAKAYNPRHANKKSLHQKAVERRRKRKNGGPK